MIQHVTTVGLCQYWPPKTGICPECGACNGHYIDCVLAWMGHAAPADPLTHLYWLDAITGETGSVPLTDALAMRAEDV